MTKDTVLQVLNHFKANAVELEGLDEAVVGLSADTELGAHICYDYDKILAVYAKEGLSEDECQARYAERVLAQMPLIEERERPYVIYM